MYDIIPIDCLPWILVAFFLGFNGEKGVKHLQNVLTAADEIDDNKVPRDSDSDSGEDSEDTETYETHARGDYRKDRL